QKAISRRRPSDRARDEDDRCEESVEERSLEEMTKERTDVITSQLTDEEREQIDKKLAEGPAPGRARRRVCSGFLGRIPERRPGSIGLLSSRAKSGNAGSSRGELKQQSGERRGR